MGIGLWALCCVALLDAVVFFTSGGWRPARCLSLEPCAGDICMLARDLGGTLAIVAPHDSPTRRSFAANEPFDCFVSSRGYANQQDPFVGIYIITGIFGSMALIACVLEMAWNCPRGALANCKPRRKAWIVLAAWALLCVIIAAAVLGGLARDETETTCLGFAQPTLVTGQPTAVTQMRVASSTQPVGADMVIPWRSGFPAPCAVRGSLASPWNRSDIAAACITTLLVGVAVILANSFLCNVASLDDAPTPILAHAEPLRPASALPLSEPRPF